MQLETVTATGLAAWASYLMNGDDSGISPDDKTAADKFAQWLAPGRGRHCFADCEPAGFMWRPDSFRFMPLGGDCETYTALVPIERESA